MVTQSEKKMVAEILRTIADDVDKMDSLPSEFKCKATIYDIFTAMQFIDEWWK